MSASKAHQIYIQPNPVGNPCLIITDESEQANDAPFRRGNGPVKSDRGAGCRKRVQPIDTIEWFGHSGYTTTIDFGAITPLAGCDTKVTITSTTPNNTWISGGVFDLDANDGERYKYTVTVTDGTGVSISEDPQIIVDGG